MAEKIRKRVTVFAEGKLQVVDLNENGNIVKRYDAQGKDTVVQKKEQPVAKSDKPLTKKQLMAALKEKGVTFKATLSSKALQELLDAANAPPGDDQEQDEPDVDQGGTGNQDVI